MRSAPGGFAALHPHPRSVRDLPSSVVETAANAQLLDPLSCHVPTKHALDVDRCVVHNPSRTLRRALDEALQFDLFRDHRNINHLFDSVE